ncbi:hypothetical protein M231_04321 [Tremella mesenterica]|uniref:Pali-domain-containing protein n=1 Tax=Tremella mesenterica TaxID=5217 RepID=A0A4Q1BLA6_TREME|nr:hypothetical protein M231_04321 [Tremella mesenterica]
MAVGYFLSCFLLFAATVLLLIATISAPIWDKVAFMKVQNNGAKIAFGTFGYCQSGGSNNGCSDTALGYNIAALSGAVTDWTYVNNHLETVTKALILHPIACGISGIAFLIALVSHRIGFLFSSLVAFLAFIVSLAVMIIDFVLFGIIRHEIRDNSSGTANYSTAIWLVLAATVILFFATFVVLFECCAGRSRDRKYASTGYAEPQMAPATGYGRTWYGRKRYY